jgi:hypothetical protein
LYPETKRGGLPGAPGGGKQAKSEIISSFAEDTADKTGYAYRYVSICINWCIPIHTSMQQKPEGEKYSRVTITLPPGLYQEAKSRCNDTGLSLSTVIGDLLSTWMRGELSTPITQGDNERLTYLEERVKAISDKIESPIHTDTNQYAQDITDIRARLEALEQVPLIATKAKENLITHTGNGYEGCQNSDKAPKAHRE